MILAEVFGVSSFTDKVHGLNESSNCLTATYSKLNVKLFKRQLNRNGKVELTQNQINAE